MTHRGEIVEKVMRRSGYSLTKLAKKLGISRNTLYNRFKNANVSYQFIMEVGKITHYDFTFDFPQMKEDASVLEEDQPREVWRIEKQYTELLEKNAKLLAILTRLSNQKELPTLRQEITQMIEKEAPGILKY
jgi:transcriptional regulator with XRE-family HTH domain